MEPISLKASGRARRRLLANRVAEIAAVVAAAIAILALGVWALVHWYRRSSATATNQTQLRGSSAAVEHSVELNSSRDYEFFL